VGPGVRGGANGQVDTSGHRGGSTAGIRSFYLVRNGARPSLAFIYGSQWAARCDWNPALSVFVVIIAALNIVLDSNS